jgi:hypothetical protein
VRAVSQRADDIGDQSTVEIKVCSEPATAASARCKAGGNVFPRFPARRRIPLQALALKKNRCGTGPASKTSDNEHAAPALCQAEVLSVKNSVGPPIPELCQSTEQ